MKKLNYILIILLFVVFTSNIFAIRIKDISNVEGVSGVQVIGYGIVVGLNQTGDNQLTEYTNQSVINMLKRFGLTTTRKNNRMRNVAAVMVTATIPTFSKIGQKIDVTVSSMGDATSLQGGTLLLTPLATSTGEIIGNAQGPLTVGGYDYRTLGSQVSKNFVTSGRVPNGLILNQSIESQITDGQTIRISLRESDFTTITRLSNQINSIAAVRGNVNALDASTVEIQLPAGLTSGNQMALISQIENLDVTVDPQARVVINERTGTIVIGGNVNILPAVISHGGLEINIQRQVVVPQPAPFTILPPRIAETASIDAKEEIIPAAPLEVGQGTTVDDMANALNLLEVKPRDLIAIFQALKEAGVLQGELIIQ